MGQIACRCLYRETARRMHCPFANSVNLQPGLCGAVSVMNDELVARLNEMEARLAFQDDTIEALNEVVSRQELELVKLQRALELLARRQVDLAASMPGRA